MAFYYPEGSFGPVCDLPPTDAEIAQRARFAVSDTERLGEDSERVVTLDLTGLYDSMQEVIGVVPSFLKRQRCKQRTLPDGTIENYDCVWEYQGDLGENYDSGWNSAEANNEVSLGNSFPQPTLSPTSCSQYRPDINIRPLTFFNANGTLVTKTATEGSSPVTFPVESEYLWSSEANEYGVWTNAGECTLPLAPQSVTYKINITEAGTYGFTFAADDTGSVTIGSETSAFITNSGGMTTTGTPTTATRSLSVGILLVTVICTNEVANPPTITDDEYLWRNNPGGWYLKICKGGACGSATSISWVTSGPHPLWSSFMNTYAVFPSDSNPLLDAAQTATYNINIPTTGNYDFECQADNTATFTLDGTQIATSSSYTTSSTATLSNLSAGMHTLVVSVTNTTTSGNVANTWTDNPGGAAWTISQSGAIIASSLNLSTSGDGNLFWHTRKATGYTYSIT